MRRGRRPAALLLSLLVALVGTVPLAASAVAAPAPVFQDPGLTVSVTDFASYRDGHVAKPGDTYTLQLAYQGASNQGRVVSVAAPSGVRLAAGSLTFPGNGAVDSASVVGDTIEVRFKDPIPEGSNQGFLTVTFQVDLPSGGPGEEELVWSVDGQPSAMTVIVGDPAGFWNETSSSARKDGTVTGGALDAAIEIDPSGTAVLNAATVETVLDGLRIDYTVDVVAVDGGTYAFTDTIADGLVFDDASFRTQTTWWSADGITSTAEAAAPFAPAPDTTTVPGTATADLALPALSRTAITYSAVAAPRGTPERAALVAAVQAGFDAATIGEIDGGSFSILLGNRAVLNPPTGPDLTAARDVTLRGTRAALPGPDTGAAFGKSVSPSPSDVEVTTRDSATGALGAADQTDLTYTLTADLRRLDPARAGATFDARFAPTTDVIVRDTLPEGVEWSGSGVMTLTTDAGAPLVLHPYVGDLADFAATSTPGDWVHDGRTLLVNVGRDVAASYRLAVPARVVALPASGQGVSVTQNPGDLRWADTRYRLTNAVEYSYTDGFPRSRSYTRTAGASFVVAKPDGETLEWDDQFRKSASGTYRATVGESIGIPFQFTVGTRVETDLAQSVIVDRLDASVFDVGAPDFLDRVQVAGTYGGTPLTRADVDLTLGAVVDGHAPLELRLAESFTDRAADAGGRMLSGMTVTVTVPTIVFAGKQTLAIANTATLQGGDTARWDWTSTASARATSYGDELEVTKVVDAGDGWAKSLRIDPNGAVTGTDLRYRIDVVPHGTFSGLTGLLFDITDSLPSTVDFVGFTDAAGTVQGTTQMNLSGGLVAVFHDSTRRITIENGSGGGQLGAATISLYYTVRIADGWTQDEGIVNSVDGVKAVVTPTTGYPLLVEKLDATGSTNPDGSPRAPITDRDARFTITGPDGLVTDEAYVVDGLLRVADGSGGDASIVLPDPGTYTVIETVAPRGYLLAGAATTIEVVPDEAPDAVQLYNTPIGSAKVSVGDLVWVDTNRDGRQDAGEPGIPGVVLELAGPDGGPVTDVSGRPVGTTTTGADGTYLFDDLPLLSAGESYTVRVVRDDPSTVTALERYAPTSAGVGDRAGDSSTWETSSEGLTTGGEHDPTLDFGFVVKTYAIGDYVWIDRDADGVQGDGEAVLPGVTVELLVVDSGGALVPATDVTGVPVPAQVTDAEGRYLFDALPVATYRVRFTLTEEQSAAYRFTAPDVGGDAVDSDAVVDGDPRVGLTREVVLDDANAALTGDYDRPLAATQGVDPTWDAGVVRRSVSVGDLVWVDTDRDGRQDPGEPGIPGVVLEVLGPDGGPVTDVYGDPVGTATTDADGRYLFRDLPVLAAGESYTVRIIRDDPSTVEALRPYTPTSAGAGDREGDSSAWSASSEGLTVDGEADLTLDFGFVLLDPVPVGAGAAPADPGAEGSLPVTGVEVGPTVLAAVALVLLGGLLLATRMRRRNARSAA